MLRDSLRLASGQGIIAGSDLISRNHDHKLARSLGRGTALRAEGTRLMGGKRALIAALASVLLASCSTSGKDEFFGFAAGSASTLSATEDFAGDVTNSAAGEMVVDENDPALPDAVAAAPTLRPTRDGEVAVVEDAETQAAVETAALPATGATANSAATETAADAAAPTPVETAATATAVEEQGSTDDQAAEPTQVVANVTPQAARPAAPKKKNFLSAFFSAPARSTSAPQMIRQEPEPESEPKPIIELASAEPATPIVTASAASFGGEALPGVRADALFEITRKSGLDDDSDVDLHEDDGGLYQVASAAGLARLAPNGLMKQTDRVDVACLKPSLVRVLKLVERHYGKRAVVTSGYRSPDRNRRARGARNSLHMYCAAADVQIEGVSKWELAKFVRSMPGRGGVGTYCHTESVHIDVGRERDWNWRCGRRSS